MSFLSYTNGLENCTIKTRVITSRVISGYFFESQVKDDGVNFINNGYNNTFCFRNCIGSIHSCIKMHLNSNGLQKADLFSRPSLWAIKHNLVCYSEGQIN